MINQNMAKLLLLTQLVGCASVVPKGETPDIDPFEPTNRKIYYFNKQLDAYVLKPTAIGYTKVTPKFVRTGVGNFFANLQDIPATANNFLQGDPSKAGQSLARFGINTTVGLFGLLEVADKIGLEKNPATFGQTLQSWGISYSPYIMLPFLGPSTVRDSGGRLVDSQMNPLWWVVDDDELRLPFSAMTAISTRAALLNNEHLVDTVAFDEYVFIRNAYLQRVGTDTYDSGHDGDDFDDYDDEF